MNDKELLDSENNDLHLPDRQDKKDLEVKGNTIYLPEKHDVDFKSREYENDFLKSLPDDVASEVRSVLRSKRNPLTILKIAIVFLFLAVSSLVVYYYFPRQIVVETHEISRKSFKNQVDNQYRSVVANAKKMIEKKDWRSAAELLETPALEIANDDKIIQDQENGLLLGLYFDAVEHSVDYPLDIPKKIAETLNTPSRYLGWYLDWLWLNYPECRYTKRNEPDADRAKEIKNVIDKLSPPNEYWKDVPDYEENKDLLYLYWSRLNYSYWCYLNPKKNLDKDDPGIFEREQAYKVSKLYTEVDNCNLDFLQLQIEIIRTTIDAGIGISELWYFFDGEAKWDSNKLNEQLKELEAKKIKLEESK